MSAAVVGVVVLVLVFARVGGVPGPTTRLYLATGEARGVISGTEVWRSGVKIGAVRSVAFRSVTVDTSQRLLVAFEIQNRYRPEIRRDTRGQIRTGGNIIGAPVVALDGGTPTAPEVAPGDTLVTAPHRGDFDGAIAQFSEAAQNVPVILGNLQSVEGEIFSHEGTLGALTTPAGAHRIAQLNRHFGRLTARVFTGNGTAAKFASEDARTELLDRANRVLAAIDSAERFAQLPMSSIGRFRADSTLPHALYVLRADLDTTRAWVNGLVDGSGASPIAVGTIGLVRTDSTLRTRLDAAHAALDRLITDVELHPDHYIAF